jgi:hypothetical protein
VSMPTSAGHLFVSISPKGTSRTPIDKYFTAV